MMILSIEMVGSGWVRMGGEAGRVKLGGENEYMKMASEDGWLYCNCFGA